VLALERVQYLVHPVTSHAEKIYTEGHTLYFISGTVSSAELK